MKDNGTPLSRLKAAVEHLDRLERQHVEKQKNLKEAQKQLDERSTQEAAVAKELEAARVAVKKAAKDMAE